MELDHRVEARAGLWLSEIFALHGEEYYRRLETQCLTEMLADSLQVVIALSGGIVHNKKAFELVRRSCRTIWLYADPKDHMQRVIDLGDHRPMAGRANAMSELNALLESRESLYRQADIRIDTSSNDVSATVTELQRALNPDLREPPEDPR